MIGFLAGTAAADDLVVIDGVGYVVTCPDPLPAGQDVQLHVHTVVRDDAIDLYGFTDPDDKRMFIALTKVPNIGPASAMALLHTVGTSEVIRAVEDGDTKTLKKAKGIGKKGATNLVAMLNVPDGLEPAPSVGSDTTRIAAALAGMGFDDDDATAAASKAIADNPDGDDSIWLKTALQRMQAA